MPKVMVPRAQRAIIYDKEVCYMTWKNHDFLLPIIFFIIKSGCFRVTIGVLYKLPYVRHDIKNIA